MIERVLCPVLVRRDDELGALEDALLAAHRGESRFVQLAGEAGIGKTRLVAELARSARKLGCPVLVGSCSEAPISLPYLPFVEAIGNFLATQDVEEFGRALGPARRELSQLFPQLSDGASPEPGGDAAQARLRLFEALVSLLAAAARERALVLVVEDVHWADDSTRELLDHLARRLTALNALLVVTYRSDELHRRHALLPSIQAWRRSGVGETIKLEPLPPDGVAEMIRAIFEGTPVEDGFRNLMHGRSEGNPFVLEEMLKEAIDRGDIYRSGIGWERKGLDELRIPETVRDTIMLRVSRLDPEHAAVLQAAAVLGRSFDYAMLLAVSAAGDAVVQAALEAAVAQQLVEEDTGRPGRFRWRHALTQEAISSEIVLPRRQQVHSAAADALASDPGTPLAEVAYHLLEAGRFEEAVPVCIEGAAAAERTAAFADAISLLERALPHITDPVERAVQLCRIGRAYAGSGAPTAAASLLEEGIASLEAQGEELAAARFRVFLGRTRWELLESETAMREFERARDVLAPAGPSADLALAYMRIAGLHVFELDYEACLAAANEAVATAEAAGADFERVWSLAFVALGLEGVDFEHAFAAMDECFHEAVRKGYPLIAGNVTYNDVWTRVHTLQPGARERLERWRALAPVSTIWLASSYVNRVEADLERALSDADRALALFAGAGFGKMEWRASVQRAEVLLELDRLEEALRELPARASRVDRQDIIYDAAVRVRLALGRGDVDGAAALAEEIAEHAAQLGHYRETIALGVEAFVAAGRLDDASALVAFARGHPVRAGQGYMLEAEGRVALARGDAGAAVPALERAVADAEAAGQLLPAWRMRALLGEARGAAGDLAGAERELTAVVEAAGPAGAGLVSRAARDAAGRLGIALPEPAVDVRPAVEPMALGEQLVTSLFADVRGYSELTRESAPAELSEKMAALYRFARTEIERHYGMVDKFAGDAVMATFNVSGSRVDHCLQALRAAMALRDKAALLDLQLGIGIAVGPAVVGRGASPANVAVQGVATNLAARLQAAAGGGEILLSEEAHRRVQDWLSERAIHVEREELALKGFDQPQPAYRLAAPVATAP